MHATLSKFTCKEGCPHYGGTHPIGARAHGYQYNAAAIPQALAEEVSEHVHAKFYRDRIRYSKPHLLTEEEKEEFNQGMSDGKAEQVGNKQSICAQQVTSEEENSSSSNAEQDDEHSRSSNSDRMI